MNKKRVYLFGAGASNSYRGSINKVNPPLARDFFKVFNKLKISGDLMVRVGDIVNYVARTRKIDASKFNTWNEDIEAFLTEVDNKIINKLSKNYDIFQLKEDIRTYDQMIFLFTSVLNEIQNGKVCMNYLALIDYLNEDDTLITFNWDTLLDRALYEKGIWHIDDGYDIEFKAIFRDSWENCSFNNKSKVKLIKLHGSTNWLMPYYSVNPSNNRREFANKNISEKDHPIFCFHYNTKEYETYENRSYSDKKYSPFSYYYYPPNIPLQKEWIDNGDRNVYSMGIYSDVNNFGETRLCKEVRESMPFIIPPVKHKNYGLIDNMLDRLWNNAEKSISECDELIIVGYSFPITDVKAWNLLRDSFNKRKQYPKITIVDPYPDGIAKRIAEEFEKISDVTIYPITFDIFVNQFLNG